MTSTPPPQTENSAWYCALIGSLVYLLLFFPVMGACICMAMVALEGRSTWWAVWVTTMSTCTVLSFPVSIYWMWRCYLKHLYDKTYLACMLPFIVLAVIGIIEWLFH
jgi:hypothetical protein